MTAYDVGKWNEVVVAKKNTPPKVTVKTTGKAEGCPLRLD
jgi:hypothetical protein